MARGSATPFVYSADPISLRTEAIATLDEALAIVTPGDPVEALIARARALIIEGWV